jgi:hypothetical protein
MHIIIDIAILATVAFVSYQLCERFVFGVKLPPVASFNVVNSTVGKYDIAVASIAEARSKLENLKQDVAAKLSVDSELLRDDIHALHAKLDAEIVYARSHHKLIG